MKRTQIRRPFLKVLEKLGLNILEIPKNLIDRYVRMIKKMHDEAVHDWLEAKLYKSLNLDEMSIGFIDGIVYHYATRLRREYEEDVKAMA